MATQSSEPGAVYRPSALRENGNSRARDPGQHAGDTVHDSIGCKQALPIFEELVKAGQEPVGEDFPATEPGGWNVKPQSPRKPIYLSVKRKASEASEASERSRRSGAGGNHFLAAKAAEPREEDFMGNKAAL